MSRRMIDPQTIIKSQVVDDKHYVDLHEILEKYGTQTENGKSVTLQIYTKDVLDDISINILDDIETKASVVPNTAITITKHVNGIVYIGGVLRDYMSNFIIWVEISDGDYENGIRLSSSYEIDVFVIKV